MSKSLPSTFASIAALSMAAVVAAAPPPRQAAEGASPERESSPFTLPWTDESIVTIKAQRESMITFFRRWSSPGLDHVEFELLLDEMGVARADPLRPELLTLWEAHRARMIALHSSTAAGMWSAAEAMTTEWSADRWSKSMRARSESQGKRLADAQLRSIDDVHELVREAISRLPPAQREHAEFVGSQVIDRLLREDELVLPVRAGGTGADLEALVRSAARQMDDQQWRLAQPVLQRYFVLAEPLRRELVREGWRTMALVHYVKVPDDAMLREVRSALHAPQFAQSATALKDAMTQAVSELAPVIGPEPNARLAALLDAAAAPPPSVPHAAFPDPLQGELLCQLLALAPPALPEESAELLNQVQTTACPELARINAELRTIIWDESMTAGFATPSDPTRSQQRLDRRRELLARRTQVNEEFRQLLQVALGDAAFRELVGRLN